MSDTNARRQSEAADVLDQLCRELVEIGERTVRLVFDHPSMREAHDYRLAYLRSATAARREKLLKMIASSASHPGD